MPRCTCCRAGWGWISYKRHYACLDCCVSFKGVTVCPHCKQHMTDMGWDFKPPKKGQKNQWKKIRLMKEEKLFGRWPEGNNLQRRFRPYATNIYPTPPNTLGEAKQLEHLVKNPSTSYKGKHNWYRW